MTFQQAKELAGHLKKGEHGSTGGLCEHLQEEGPGRRRPHDRGENPVPQRNTRFSTRSSGRGCRSCSMDWPNGPRRRSNTSSRPNGSSPIRERRSNMAGTGRSTPSRPTLRMPPFETFGDSESHAATVAHELTHWTRHPSQRPGHKLRVMQDCIGVSHTRVTSVVWRF